MTFCSHIGYYILELRCGCINRIYELYFHKTRPLNAYSKFGIIERSLYPKIFISVKIDICKQLEKDFMNV